MPAVAVVSRRGVLPIELRRQGFEVVDVREVDHLPGVLDASVAAVVVDAPEPEVARQVLAVVAVAAGAPPVVVLGDGPDEGTTPPSLRVTRLEVPVSTAEVASALRELLPSPRPESVPRPRVAPDSSDPVGPPSVPDVVDVRGRGGTDAPVRALAPVPGPEAVGAAETGAPDTSRGRWRRWAGRGARTGAPAAAEPEEQTWQEATDVVLAALPFLSPVDEVVASLLDAAVQDADAQAGCVLLEEDGAWPVAAELGLRMGERRLAPRRGDWLVERLTAQPVILRVDDTDDARAALAGVPLASWRSVVAFPVAGGGAVVVLARDTTRFASHVVRTLPSVASLFDPLVRDALLALRLRRALDTVC